MLSYLSTLLLRNISYYNNNYLQYYEETAFINLSDIYRELSQRVNRGALILDAGCGVGRDTRYFIKHGYRVVAFDASYEMRDLCRQYPFAYCLRRSFSEIKFVEEFDAVWACASLIHLPNHNFQEAIFRLFNAIKPGGIIYFSLKEKDRDEELNKVSKDRYFYYYSLDEIREIIEKGLSMVHIKIWTTQSMKQGDPTQWTNFLYCKPRNFPSAKEVR